MRIDQIVLDANVATSVLARGRADFPITTAEKLRFADTHRNGHITNAVFGVCSQKARIDLLCDPDRVPIPPTTIFIIAAKVGCTAHEHDDTSVDRGVD